MRRNLNVWRLCGSVVALLLLFAALGVAADEHSRLRVEGIEQGAIYFEPVAPKVVLAEGLAVVEQQLNGEPYDGSEVSEQGLHTFQVTVSDGQDQRFCSTIRFWVLDPGQRSPVYTVDMVRLLVERLAGHPHVTPTPSADERLVVGRSRGWPQDPAVPAHDLYGLQITAPETNEPKLRVVLVGGNHPREQTGSWALHGALDFLVSDDPRAQELRRRVTFFIYPMVNPDGRYALSGRSNPEMQAEKVTDHNRVWNTAARFSTIDAFVNAIKTDTGGSAEYLLDFHSAGSTFFFAGTNLMTSPYAQAMTAREPKIAARRSEGHPGMIRNWAMSDEGLGVPFAYTPELAGGENAKRSMEFGRSFMLAFHDLITGSAPLAEAVKTLRQAEGATFGREHRERISAQKDALQQTLNSEQAPVLQTLEAVYAVYDAINQYRESIALAEQASDLISSGRNVLERFDSKRGAGLRESLQEHIDQLASSLGTPHGDLETLRARTDSLVGTIDRFHFVIEAESAVQAASEMIEDTLDGFGRLFQNDVRRNRDQVIKLAGDSGTKAERIRQATGALDESIARYWQVCKLSPFPAVRPVPLHRAGEVVEIHNRADWSNGLLVDLEATDEGLVPGGKSRLRFDGDGDYVETSFVPGESTLGQQFTWEFWKQFRTFADATGSSGNRGGSTRFYVQLTGSDDGLRTAIGDSYWTSTTLAEPDRWYHIAIVFDHGEAKTYVDSDLRDTRTDVKFSGDSSSPFAIGRGFGDGRWLDGYTKEHRIWNVARSHGDLRRSRYRQFDEDEPGLVGYWRLDEGENSTVLDWSGSANHGTITGATWEPQSTEGFRISQPIAFATGIELSGVTVTWEVAANDDAGVDRVAVSFGLSDDDATLPPVWLAAINGESLSMGADKVEFAGRCLWVQQTISSHQPDPPVKLQRLAVSAF